jgi:hypothetical protein
MVVAAQHRRAACRKSPSSAACQLEPQISNRWSESEIFHLESPSPAISTSSKLFTTFLARSSLFSTLSELFRQKRPGWGYPLLNLTWGKKWSLHPQNQLHATIAAFITLPLVANVALGLSTLAACFALAIARRSPMVPMTWLFTFSSALATSRTLKVFVILWAACTLSWLADAISPRRAAVLGNSLVFFCAPFQPSTTTPTPKLEFRSPSPN